MDNLLTKIESQAKSEFEKTNRILTFEEYMSLAASSPKIQVRGSAQYMLDMLESFGREERPGSPPHFKLFDMELGGDGTDARFRVIAQNEVQQAIHRALSNFVKEGVNNKLILLHGPNGSAKSSLVNCLTKGLERYSETPSGALYRFNWVFPVEKVVKGSLGLASYSGTKIAGESYAKLGDEDVAARVVCDMKDHPLLLLPAVARREWLASVTKKSAPLPDYLTKGDLCHKCKMIAEALFTAYKGDLKRVFQHVQVERFYISKRYRNGAVTIEPQMHVDAAARQVTMDKSLSFLPPSLQSVSLFELSGDLVDGNRGVVEYADLLKRPVDTYKYLLIACESGAVNVGPSIAFLDSVLIGSTNELQLDAFKEFPDFTSFKARIELIRVPYLLEYSEESKIYDLNLAKMAGEKHVSPHTTHIASLWAVLTRLKKPNAIHYSPNLTSTVGSLAPLEKARLYDHGEVPPQLSPEERKVLKAGIRRLRDEYTTVPYYEGRMGASAREIKSILYDAAQNPEFKCLSPLAVLFEIEEFIKRRGSEYDFLKQDVKDGYHDNGEFVNVTRNALLDLLDQEVRESMGIFESHRYEEFLRRYIINLSSLLKKEKIKNSITGKMEPPDMTLIEEFEGIVEAPAGGAERETFRNGVISSIGAYALDHAKQLSGSPVDYRLVFPDYMKKLETHYFNQQKSKMSHLGDAIQFLGTEREDATADHHKLARETISKMVAKLGYCEECARQSILFLIKSRY